MKRFSPSRWLLAAVVLTVIGPSVRAQSPVSFTLKQDGKVSLAIYDSQGQQVRTLLSTDPRAAGTHSVSWDGLDRSGQPAPAGNYTWKLISSPGIKAEYLLSIGTSVGHDHWPCQHGGPKSVAVEGESFIMGGSSEGSPVLAKAGFDGKVIWQRGNFPAPEALIDMAADGGRLYALMSSSILERLDSATGEGIKGPKGQGRLRSKLWLPFKDLGKIDLTTDQSNDKAKTPARRLDVEVPNGRYLVRVKARLSKECSPGAELTCQIGNDRTNFKEEGLRPGGVREVIGPLVYRNHHPIHVRNGVLPIVFDFRDAAGKGEWAIDEIEILAPAERLDAAGGALAVLYPSAGVVAWLDPETGAILDKTSVAGARDIAVAGKDDLFITTGDSIRRIRRGETKAETVIDDLNDADRLSFDPAGKRLFVACGGKTHQVLVFDAGFKKIAALGREGGRLAGAYKGDDFHSISDIAADGKGGFVITEDNSAPRRTARFDAKGTLLKEWYGGQQFYTFPVPEPENPNLVWMDSQWGWLMQTEVDWTKRTWKVRACYPWAKNLDPMLFPTGKMATRMFPFRGDLVGRGKQETYIWLQASGLLLRVDEDAREIVPVSYLGRAFPNQFWNWNSIAEEKYPQVFKDALAPYKVDTSKKGQVGQHLGFSWADLNGDGKVQAEEIKIVPPSLHRNGHGFNGGAHSYWMNPKSFELLITPRDRENEAYAVRAPEKLTPQGVPVWEWQSDFAGKNQLGPKSPYPFTSTKGMRQDAAGNVYVLMAGGGDHYSAGLDSFHSHGAGWPGTLADRVNIVKYTPKGQTHWVVGNKASRYDCLPGQTHLPIHVAGFAKGCVGVADYFVVPCHFWTDDGLYAGSLLDGRVNDGLPDRLYAWWRQDRKKGDQFDNLAAFQYDMLVGGSLLELPGGDVVFMGAGWNNIPCFKVHGLDALARQEGVTTIKQPAPAAVAKGNGLQAEYFAKADLSGDSILKHTDAQVWFGHPTKKVWPEKIAEAKAFSARWTGQIEPRFSEDYTMSLYATGGVRLWIGDKLILDQWTNKKARLFSEPISLRASQKHPIRIEFANVPSPKDGPELHLNWESASQNIEHIPQLHLYVPDA